MTRRVPWGLLAALFVIVPLVEIYLVVQAGQAIGIGWTILILVADSLLGAALLKHQGTAAWRALQEALAAYRMPAKELADGVLVLVGGTLLLTPGFVTDAVGFFLILPFTRPLARKALTALISRRLLGGPPGPAGRTGQPRTGQPRTGQPRTDQPRTGQRPGPDSVVQGEVVD